jgi:hypothetical protein
MIFIAKLVSLDAVQDDLPSQVPIVGPIALKATGHRPDEW